MPEGIDFSGWPVWAVIVLMIALWYKDKVGEAIPFLGRFLGRRSDERHEQRDHLRRRAEYRENKQYEILEGTLDWMKQESQKDREEAAKQRKQNAGMLEAINRNTTTVSQNTEIIRILAMNSAQVEDRLRSLEQKWSQDQRSG